MEIQINQNNASEFIIETNKIRWKLYAQKIIVSILLLFLWGVYCFISEINQGYDTSTSYYKYNKDFTVTYVNKIQNNYHTALGFSIASLLFSFYLFIYLVRQRKQFFKTVKDVANRHKLTSENYVLKISDSSLWYQDFEITRKEKWSVFSKFKNYKDYLFLFRDNLYINCLVIDKRQISRDDLTDLLRFVSRKLVEKK